MGTIRVLPDDQIEELLRTATVGRIACCAHGAAGDDGRPFLVPLAYGYDGESVYAFGVLGRKNHIMRAQPKISFEVDEAIAEDRWSSVIADGEYEEMLTAEDRRFAHTVIFGERSLFPEFTPEQIVYRLRLSRKTGRFEIPDGEQPPVGAIEP